MEKSIFDKKFVALYLASDDDTLVGTFDNYYSLSLFLGVTIHNAQCQICRIKKGKIKTILGHTRRKYNVYFFDKTPNDNLEDLKM